MGRGVARHMVCLQAERNQACALSNFSARMMLRNPNSLCGGCAEIDVLYLLMLAARTSKGLDLVMGFHRLMRFATRQIGSAAAFFALRRIHDFQPFFRGGSIVPLALGPLLLSQISSAGPDRLMRGGREGR